MIEQTTAILNAAMLRGRGSRRLPLRWRGRALRWRLITWLVLVVGLFGSLMAAAVWRHQVSLEATRSFDAQAGEVGSNVATALLRVDDLAVSTGALLGSEPNLTNRKLASWWESMGADSRYAGIEGLGYIEFVPATGLRRFNAQLRADPIPGAAAVTFRPPTSGRSAQKRYCLARLGIASPLNATALLPGLDFCSIPGFDALQDARDSGGLVALVLGERLVVLFTPVYAGGIDPPTVEARRDRIEGVVTELVDVHSILGQALAGHRDFRIEVARQDLAAVPTAARGVAGHFAMQVGPLTTVASLGSVHGQAFQKAVDVDADGRWVVIVSQTQARNLLTPGVQATMMLVGGVLISGLVFLVVRMLSTSRARALRVIDERTRQLRHQALHDALTDLPNRKLLMSRAQELLANRYGQDICVAALFIDIDGFKGVNDTLGHLAGDELLREVARRIVATLRSGDMVGRMGGDEFVVLSAGRPTEGGPEALAERVLEAMREPFSVGSPEPVLISVTASIGVALGDRGDAEEMIGDADIALYRAKTAGRNQYVVFSAEMRAAAPGPTLVAH